MRTSQKLTGETEQNLEFDDYAVAQVLFGVHNHNLHTIEQAVQVQIYDRGNTLNITGRAHAVELATSLLSQLYDLVRKGYPIFSQDIAFGIKILESSPAASLAEIFLDKVCITAQKRVISPKSIHQKNYIEAIRKNDIVFGIGPAGTGKTYLAVAMAVS
ncbi:MAG: phosphate starvation-inducible protein PhoH, partial [Candidatus Electrothrix sp. AUS4]|nr:phosphate starvation-inducible protein PhoH [Candidatus Electrothrix sp. AUS4]